MADFRFPLLTLMSGALVLATQAPLTASAAAPRQLVIGVDHQDADHPNPQEQHALFEYTDFFSRDVRVQRGETLDFRTAPGAFHIVALARSEGAARKAYPVALLDSDDPVAPGSQHSKIELGPSNGPIMNGTTHGGGTVGGPNDLPTCGLAGEPQCTFSGGDDVESEGGVAGFGSQGPAPVDWKITINAAPGGYTYFCFIHPGMRGHLTVIDDNDGDGDVTTQAQVDAASAQQFRDDREDAFESERAANEVHFSGGAPGTRTYDVSVGMNAAENHVAIDEMLPQHLNLEAGDKVVYHWRDPHNVHTVDFPAGSPNLPPPFIPDVEPPPTHVELVGDPGNAPPGTLLTKPGTLVDAGLFIGTAYHVQPTVQQWSVRTRDNTTQGGRYAYQCTVHDFMAGTLDIAP